MIWKFDFSRRALLWLLGLSFVAGTGLEVWEQWTGSRAVRSAGIVSLGKDPELLRLADSLHQVRLAELARPVDLNTADATQLERLPGVGPVIAARILDYRDAHGGFRDVEELDSVSGIGPKKLAELRERVTVSQP